MKLYHYIPIVALLLGILLGRWSGSRQATNVLPSPLTSQSQTSLLDDVVRTEAQHAGTAFGADAVVSFDQLAEVLEFLREAGFGSDESAVMVVGLANALFTKDAANGLVEGSEAKRLAALQRLLLQDWQHYDRQVAAPYREESLDLSSLDSLPADTRRFLLQIVAVRDASKKSIIDIANGALSESDRTTLRQIDEKMYSDAEAVLSADEFIKFQGDVFRSSEDFKLMYKALPLDASAIDRLAVFVRGETAGIEESAAEQLHESFRQEVGDEVYLTIMNSRDPAYREIKSIIHRFELDPSIANQFIDFRNRSLRSLVDGRPASSYRELALLLGGTAADFLIHESVHNSWVRRLSN